MSVRTFVEVLEIFGILQVCQLLTGKILRNTRRMSLRTDIELLEVLGCVFYTEARSIRDIIDITGMPAYDKQNTREIQGQ